MKILDKLRAASKKAVDARTDLQLAVEELRNELFKLNGERFHIEEAPISREETAAKIKLHLDHLEGEAMRRWVPSTFRSSASGKMAPNADGVFHLSGIAGSGGGGGFFATPNTFQGVGGLCVLGFRNQIEAALLAHAIAASPGDGLSESERAAKLRKIDADIDAAERAEEHLIREAESAGIVVHRRRDARPEIYLAETV
ncbi:hypothetical protein [Rhizobium sp. NZLR1]|uniref:hypothetical protein n=1 Tax=Rhizobium sp. NZLR1 TaxID=2731096 RepID=UPI001A99804B|nr:hypothetical protein [Rhizobium sp. NZLR1]MBX5202236.1 hypothetical protein [Rhizobium sp. NZLR1]QSZ20850.1 hypothetical protein J3O30_21585 [Rhizobium sp. NZLR1]